MITNQTDAKKEEYRDYNVRAAGAARAARDLHECVLHLLPVVDLGTATTTIADLKLKMRS